MSAGPVIGVIDYGMGNRRSVEKALARVGARPIVSSDVDELRGADGLVLPGVGAFPRAIENLRRLGLDELIAERVGAGVPLLGVCLGLELLFEESDEQGGAAGLGLLPGRVGSLRSGRSLKLPHIGWNLVSLHRPSELTAGLPAQCAFYHVHSFVARPADDQDVLGTSEYGEEFASVVARDTLFGVQFHPEKSSTHGLALLRNFSGVCARVAA